MAEDVGTIYSTLFDHKPTLRREVEYFVREFEEKRKDREVENLLHTLDHITELIETEIPRAESLGEIHLPKLIGEVQVAESISDKLMNIVENSDKKYTESLEQKRGERVAEWDAFVHDMTTKCIRIDNLYRDKQNEARVSYQKAEEKLLGQIAQSQSPAT